MDCENWIFNIGKAVDSPRNDHLEGIFRIYIYAHLKTKHNFRLVFDPSYSDFNMIKVMKYALKYLSRCQWYQTI